RASPPETSSASAFTPAMRCAAMKSAGSPAPAARTWCSAAFTRRCIRTRRRPSAARTAWFAATATSCGRQCSTRVPRERRVRSTRPVEWTEPRSSRAGGICCRRAATCGHRCRRCALMARLSRLPDDMVFYTQITMEAAEDPAFLDAMAKAHIRGALVGVESVTPEGLKDVYKGFNFAGDALVERLRIFGEHGIHVLGSFIFGLPSDRPHTFEATAEVAERAGVTFAQFVMLTPFPGTLDFERWEREVG